MTLTINDTTMTSDQTAHTARQVPSPQRGWEVTWLPGQILDRPSHRGQRLFESPPIAERHGKGLGR